MQAALGDDYKVIEEGQNGRTIATEEKNAHGTNKDRVHISNLVKQLLP